MECILFCNQCILYFSDWVTITNRNTNGSWHSDTKGKPSPSQLKSTATEVQPRFSGYQQHDSSEFLQLLVDGLHELRFKSCKKKDQQPKKLKPKKHGMYI